LGADKVIDYQQEDFIEIEDQFHFIFDAVGKSSFARCKPLLVRKGINIST
jgi:NADPH:quinone reductase-like Zn-dependent oxidoreductase